MPAHTAYAAHAAEQPGTAAQYASVAPALYRAALGPVNQEHYLAAFERLDAVGRVLPGWNLAAALCPLGWLVFRRLWQQALWVVVGLALVALSLWALGHQWLALPRPMLVGLALAVWLMLCGALGLYGDALVHADVQRRIVRTVSAASTMREAIELLQGRRSSRRRLWWPVLWGVALVLVAAAVWLAFAAQMRGKPVQDVVVTAPAASVGPLPRPENEQALLAQTREPSTVVTEESSTAQEQVQPPMPEPMPEAEQVPVVPRTQGATPPNERPPQKPALRRLYINAGLFADAANAGRVHARLRQAGLPSSVEPLVRADGRRLQRVRVGPFSSAAQANAALARVRAMGLEAVAAAQ
ncbi:SPOR domain-containing protein [Alicycliphilus denitrificans]|uniref:SPOR domain-containing protein n=1 Tax=Alicycliphilus denitrificans TaxID=179636 RepID=UPI00384A6953